MVITEKIGTLTDFDISNMEIDFIDFEWHEVHKRILHKKSRSQQKVSVKFLGQNPNFTQDDVLLKTTNVLLVVNILPCDCIIIRTKSSFELASVCYEIGNRHLPLFYEENQLMVAFEKPLFYYLKALKLDVKTKNKKLLCPLKTTVSPHGSNQSLFTKIMQLTNPS